VSDFRCFSITSVEDLRGAASGWDDLWWRSESTMPTVRAELLAQWIALFKPRGRFHALVAADSKRFVAALPLVSCRVGGCVPAGELPDNTWSTCGDLLVDPSADVGSALDCLLDGFAGLPWSLLWLGGVMPESPRWRAMLRACGLRGIASCYHEWFRAARVEIDSSWDVYQKRLPKNHRQGMHRALRRLRCEGDVRFDVQSPCVADPVEPWLQTAFELEDRGWKGAAGGSVLRSPGMFRFFTDQARQLAQWGQLETASLWLDARLLAFVLGYRAKGVYYTHKISYDPEFAAFSPGQLLFHHLLERLHGDGQTRALDFLGPMSQSLSRWRPVGYGVGRLALAPRGGLSRALVHVYRHWRRRLGSLHERQPADDDAMAPEPAAAR